MSSQHEIAGWFSFTLKIIPGTLPLLAAIYWILSPQAPTTSIGDTFIWLMPAVLATLPPFVQLISREVRIKSKRSKNTKPGPEIYEDAMRSLVWSIASTVAVVLVASQLAWQLESALASSMLKPLRHRKGDYDPFCKNGSIRGGCEQGEFDVGSLLLWVIFPLISGIIIMPLGGIICGSTVATIYDIEYVDEVKVTKGRTKLERSKSGRYHVLSPDSKL